MEKIMVIAGYLVLLFLGIAYFETNIYYIGFLLPALMFIAGYSAYSVRSELGSYFGFQGGISGKNADTWEFANTYSGKLTMKVSVILLIILELLMFLLQPKPLIAELMLLPAAFTYFIVWFKTEKELNKFFDRQGNRRELLNKEEE
ncbi:MAG: hypothetical protein II270_01620 [Peptococcaceae bacterium]|nr:hypothetical protein [Peptococcaceae bacterium]